MRNLVLVLVALAVAIATGKAIEGYGNGRSWESPYTRVMWYTDGE